jgi:Protein of unknown function (DUF2950)
MRAATKTARPGARASASRSRALLLVLAELLAAVAGCRKAIPEPSKGPTAFDTPASAAKAVYLAAKSGDTNALVGIFGPEEREYLTTGDAEQDKLAYDEFAADYDAMHRWSRLQNGSLVLNVGVENYPFPFPLVKNADGQWVFSSEDAKREILARRIGENELRALDVLNSMADAHAAYFETMHDGSAAKQYAQRFVSTEGKHDGLYWKAAEGEEESPLGPLAAEASAEGYKSPEPFHGYYYRILKKQGAHAEGGAKDYLVDGKMTRGFAILAYPAGYRKSGVMSFVVNQTGVVYQKDLGPDTVSTAKAMDSYDPDGSWTVVQ